MAFDRERAKYERQIRDLEAKLREKENEKRELESKCESLQDWVDRLLDYANMSEEDMKAIVQKDKDTAEAMSMMKGLFGVMSGVGRFY